MQRLLGKDYTIEARYVYTKGVHLYVQDRLNIVPQVTPTNYIPTFLTMPSATQFASLTKTLGTTTTPGTVKGTIPAGATTGLPYNDFATLGFGQAIVGFNPVGRLQIQRFGDANDQTLLEEFLLSARLHLEPRRRTIPPRPSFPLTSHLAADRTSRTRQRTGLIRRSTTVSA